MSAMFNNFTPLLMGRGAALEIGQRIRENGGTSVFFVHDRQLPAAVVDRIKESLVKADLRYSEFCDVEPEVPDWSIDICLKAAQKAGDIDTILAVGGGSTMDTAKIVNLLLNNPPPLSDYYIWSEKKEHKPGFPLYLIPTTAGSGDEHMAAAVVCDTKNGNRKSPLVSKNCFTPKFAVIDPELTLSVPADYTAISGIDAFAHCYESYTGQSQLWTPLSDLAALEGMRLAVNYLPLTVKEPGNVEYREKMCLAATLGGIATEMARNHAGHSLAHALGSTVHAPHGVCVACVEPFMAEHYTRARCEKNRTVLGLFGVDAPADAAPEEIGALLRDAMLSFIRDAGVPKLDSYGVTAEMVYECRDIALADPLMHRISEADVSGEVLDGMLKNICRVNGLE